MSNFSTNNLRLNTHRNHLRDIGVSQNKKYWATSYEKERIEAKEKYDKELMEQAKIEKYNPDDIFKRNNSEMNYHLFIVAVLMFY